MNPSTFQGKLIKMTAPGVEAVTAQLTDIDGNQYLIAAPTAEDVKRLLTGRFQDMPVEEAKFLRVSILIHDK